MNVLQLRQRSTADTLLDFVPLTPETSAVLLQHDLSRHFGELRAIRTRERLVASPLWARIGREVDTLLDSVEREDTPGARPLPRRFRAGAWNIHRGTNLDNIAGAITGDPELARVDLWCLSEVDNGLGRSANRNVARELAERLGMGYAFAVSYLTLEDDFGENAANTPNTLALAGSAILSRAPILRAVSADVPAVRDKFNSSEKRLGRKRATLAEIATEGGPVVVAQAHLDSNADSPQRATQLDAILAGALRLGDRVLLGGDLNTTTYQYSSTARLMRDVAHKLLVTGFEGTIDNYLTPEQLYERPIFDVLRARGLTVDGFNLRGEGTMIYDLKTEYAYRKVVKAAGPLIARWLRSRLRSRNGLVAAHLDWFAGTGIRPVHAAIARPRGEGGVPPSDHDPIVVDVEI
jgi:endonuclease/exonuclease/phosphatase family metal-dependent hydrolase